MKIYTSYFYQIRFFPKNLIPLSTAMYDPKWFHDFRGYNFVFKDNNGVINGLRATEFSPKGGECHGIKGCPFTPETCPASKSYSKQLNNIIFDTMLADYIKDSSFL